ncbi:hypothetical protein M885DRAFT_170962 [Pelagophyceae sp. CCMP2097]|nr:hypothetical protein M885DRAFT_170962 [Pelagophyceae sp. CCMP2097]
MNKAEAREEHVEVAQRSVRGGDGGGDVSVRNVYGDKARRRDRAREGDGEELEVGRRGAHVDWVRRKLRARNREDAVGRRTTKPVGRKGLAVGKVREVGFSGEECVDEEEDVWVGVGGVAAPVGGSGRVGWAGWVRRRQGRRGGYLHARPWT